MNVNTRTKQKSFSHPAEKKLQVTLLYYNRFILNTLFTAEPISCLWRHLMSWRSFRRTLTSEKNSLFLFWLKFDMKENYKRLES